MPQSPPLDSPVRTSSNFEAISVPVEALKNLPANLPNLTSLGIMNYDAGAADQPQLAAYLDAFLPTTQQCARLANLDIELGEYPSLTCQPDTWALIPTGLQHLCCACYMAESPSFNTLIRRVPSLCLVSPPCDDLLQLLREFPVLESLELLHDETMWLVCDEPQEEDDSNHGDGLGLGLLKTRLLDGSLTLTCPSMGFEGTAEGIQDVCEWLPVFPDTYLVEFLFKGFAEPLCLQDLARVFPNVYKITLDGGSEGDGRWGLEVLAPLAVLPELCELTLKCPQLVITPDGILLLLDSLHNLSDLTICARLCDNLFLDEDELNAMVAKLGRDVSVRID